MKYLGICNIVCVAVINITKCDLELFSKIRSHNIYTVHQNLPDHQKMSIYGNRLRIIIRYNFTNARTYLIHAMLTALHQSMSCRLL